MGWVFRKTLWASELCKAQPGSSSPVHVVDVVGLWGVSEAHASLPDVFTAVQGMDIFC